jgi:hypothetical protein
MGNISYHTSESMPEVETTVKQNACTVYTRCPTPAKNFLINDNAKISNKTHL